MKLPKDVAADPRHDEVLALLTTNTHPLWERGRAQVATLSMNEALAAELQRSLRIGQACQGLELIADTLAREQKGLNALAAQGPGGQQRPRISRLLLLANDGSTRFYRDSDSLLNRYEHRLVAVRLQINGEKFGEAVLSRTRLVRAILVFDKTAAARALLALLPSAPTPG